MPAVDQPSLKEDVMYPDRIESRAPIGKIRIMGEENGVPFLIGDFDEDTPMSELEEIKHDNRGVGIDVRILDSEGDPVHAG